MPRDEHLRKRRRTYGRRVHDLSSESRRPAARYLRLPRRDPDPDPDEYEIEDEDSDDLWHEMTIDDGG